MISLEFNIFHFYRWHLESVPNKMMPTWNREERWCNIRGRRGGCWKSRVFLLTFHSSIGEYKSMRKVQSLGTCFLRSICLYRCFVLSAISYLVRRKKGRKFNPLEKKIDLKPSANGWKMHVHKIHLHSRNVSNLHKIQQAIKMRKCCISAVLTALIKLYGKWMRINCLI